DLADIAAPAGEYAHRQKACDRQQIDHLAEILIGHAEGLAAVMVDEEQREAAAENEEEQGQAVHCGMFSRARRRRFVSRLGLRSTVSRRAGRLSINCRRSESL